MSDHPNLFDLLPPRTLPHQGLTPEARHCGSRAAESAARRRGKLQERYLDALLKAGASGLTDHEAAQLLRVPVSSICSTRAALRDHLTTTGYRNGPYGERNSVTVLRVTADVPFDRRTA